jgi:hypothetical protein
MLTSRSHNEEGSQVEDIEVDLDLKKPLKKEKIVLGREPLPVEISTPNVEENSSCCSKLTLSWYWTLMAMSFRKFSNGETVNASDLGRVHPQDRADYQYDIFDKLWQAELQEKGLEKASLWKVWFRCKCCLLPSPLFPRPLPLSLPHPPLFHPLLTLRPYTHGMMQAYIILYFLLPTAYFHYHYPLYIFVPPLPLHIHSCRVG